MRSLSLTRLPSIPCNVACVSYIGISVSGYIMCTEKRERKYTYKNTLPMGDFGILHVMSLVFYLARGNVPA